MFNIADYGHTLMTDFLLAGGQIVRREFHAPSELASLKEKVVINCPGYGARALWKDESLVPVRGQIAWLIPQPEVTYGVYYDGVNVVSRRDGIVLQMLDGGDMRGLGDDNESIDRAEAVEAVTRVAALYAGFGKGAEPPILLSRSWPGVSPGHPRTPPAPWPRLARPPSGPACMGRRDKARR